MSVIHPMRRGRWPAMGLLIAAMAGCGSQEAAGLSAGNAWARVNRAVFTDDDLTAELALYAPDGKLQDGAAVWQQEFLDQFVTQELLVQEAQRLGLHRDPAFMRSVERFWKQALLQTVLQRKGREIASETPVYEHDVEAFYERMKTESRARVLWCADEASAMAFSRQALATWPESGPVSGAVRDSQWQWVRAGSIEPALEDLIEATPTGLVSAPLHVRSQWVVAAVAERRPVSVKPLADLQDEVARLVRERKQELALRAWLDMLRETATVRLDAHVFDRVLPATAATRGTGD